MPFPVVFINCSALPFLSWIISGRKLYETRTRNTLRALIGCRVYLAETGGPGRPLVRASAVIGAPLAVRSREDWQRLRSAHAVPRGSSYDWRPGTKVKYLYPLLNVEPLAPFRAVEGTRHGRVYMTY